MIIKFNGDYTKKQAVINALEEYNARLDKNYSSETAQDNKYHFDEYHASNKQLNKIYVKYDNKKHYVKELKIDTLTHTLIINIDR